MARICLLVYDDSHWADSATRVAEENLRIDRRTDMTAEEKVRAKLKLSDAVSSRYRRGDVICCYGARNIPKAGDAITPTRKVIILQDTEMSLREACDRYDPPLMSGEKILARCKYNLNLDAITFLNGRATLTRADLLAAETTRG